MSWLGISAVVVGGLWYAAGWLSFFRRFIRTEVSSYDGWGDFAMIAMIGSLFATLVAPIGLLIAALRSWADRTETSPADVARKIGGETREEKLRRREDSVRERERRIERMERDLRVGPYARQ